MKKFLLYAIGVFLTAFVVVEVYDGIRMMRYGDCPPVNGGEVYGAIRNSARKQRCRRLVVGDSTGWLFYPCESVCDSNMVSLACNQAVTMAGHYMLLHRFLEVNTDNLPDKVVLVFTPSSLGNNLDQFTYHYFLKPFMRGRNLSLFTGTLWRRIVHIPLWWAVTLPSMRLSNYAPEYSLPTDEPYDMLSPLSREYLWKIMQLCDNYGVPLVIQPSPIRLSSLSYYTEKGAAALSNGEFGKCAPLMEDYVARLYAEEDSCFRDDVHLRRELIGSDYLHLSE